MKVALANLFWIINLALFGALTFNSVRTDADRFEHTEPLITVTVKSAAQFLKNPRIVFVDARPERAYREGFIPTAVSLPMGSQPSSELLTRLREAEKIVVYCDGPKCKAAERTARALISLQFANVHVLNEGFNGWTSLGLPVHSTIEIQPD